jgi:hypothetical protein
MFTNCVNAESSLEANSNESTLQQHELLYPKDIVYFSQDFYLAIRYNDPIDAYLDTIAKLNLDKLSGDLITQDIKLAFWINVYNSMVQSKIIFDENSFNNQNSFFKEKDIDFGGCKISLDEIEHGIIRAKSYTGNAFVNRFKLNQLDYRIHFTMNCGASSCPAIAYYKPETIQEDLSLAENVFVKSNSRYDSLSNTLYTSELFNWFKEDFKGESGIIDLMRINNVVPFDITPSIIYESYNWDLKSKNYK